MKRLFAALCFLSLAGCLSEPEIEDRWTILEVSSPARLSPVAPGTAVSVTLKGEIIYRSVITGAIVAEVRVSDVLGPGDVNLDPEAPRMDVLRDVDRILANSVSAGFGVAPFTGWDHLIQDVEIAFTADIPAAVPSGGGVYLLFYLADAEEVELPTGEEIIVIDPFDFESKEVFPIGVELTPSAGGS
jgi:hypothetical protein